MDNVTEKPARSINKKKGVNGLTGEWVNGAGKKWVFLGVFWGLHWQLLRVYRYRYR